MSRKKILIVTLFDDNNIGNRLQNYALQQVLLNYNADVTIIDNYYTSKPTRQDALKAITKEILGIFGVKKYRGSYQRYIGFKTRQKANQRFDKNNLKDIIIMSTEQVFKANWNDYDLAIAGSDQIWHKWHDDELELPFYYLQFMPPEKRVAYAASFGFENFPKLDFQYHKDGLEGMKLISCREKSGCELIKSTIGKDVLHVLDPTLLLSAAEWRKLEEQATNFSKHKKNYVFVYFLGEQTVEYKNYINEVMKQKNIKNIVNFMDSRNRRINNCNPCDFLVLIDHADYIFTDSFHCVVFSLIFNKEFTTFRRKQPGFEQMFGRIEELLESRGKFNCIYGENMKKSANNFDELYKASMQYIQQALNYTSMFLE